MELQLNNFRCFPDEEPACFSISEGMTAFVGPNNSGKTSLLRFFYEFRDLFNKLQGLGKNDCLANALRGKHQTISFPAEISDQSTLFSKSNDRELQIILKQQEHVSADEHNRPIYHPGKLTIRIKRPENTWSAKLIFKAQELTFGQYGTEGSFVMGDQKYRLDLGLITSFAGDIARSIFVGSFRNALSLASDHNYYDIAVGQSFIRQWHNFKSGNATIANERSFRLLKDLADLFGLDSLDVNPTPDHTSLQLIMNGKSFRLPEVGSGIAHFFITLANVAVKRPAYLFIDEPELCLHPTLQKQFLTTLASHTTKGIVFSTHSMGLARSCGERVYCVSPSSSGKSVVSDLGRTPSLAEFLGELNYSGYQELGFSKVVLVEGPTEIKTLQQLLRLYGKDQSIVCLPLGGSSMINGDREEELLEVLRITKELYALIDSEKESHSDKLSKDRKAFVDTCTKLKIKCTVLERRATENYFSDDAVKAVKGEKYKALGPFQELASLQLGWGKHENWRIAQQLNRKELDTTDLGRFLNDL